MISLPKSYSDERFVGDLLSWYDQHARILPWRGPDITPYQTWVSEIMLQQTRVETVLPYYLRFLDALPTVEALAAADEDTLHKLWQGLGYYSRVKNMKKAAEIIVKEYQGVLPSTRSELMKLPGIGPYTASAIASIAFGEKEPAVDGNVLRVITRLLSCPDDISTPQTVQEIYLFLKERIPSSRPGDFVQALMELGALICLLNGVPLCSGCPLFSLCEAHQKGQETAFPVKGSSLKRKTERYTVLILINLEGHLYLYKRPSKGLLAGLWSPYMLSGSRSREEICTDLSDAGLEVLSLSPAGHKKHVFSHLDWEMDLWQVQVSSKKGNLPGCFVSMEDLHNHYAVPNAFSFIYTR